MAESTEWQHGDNEPAMLKKQLRNLSSISSGVGTSTTTDIIAELEKITQNTADIELKAESINLNTDTLEALIATTNTRAGTNGDAADVDGTEAGQLRYIGEGIDTLTTNLGSDPATATNQSTQITNQSTQITRAHGGTGASDVYVVASTGAKTYTFHGIQVITAITISTITDTNLTGDSLAGVTLNPGYHPIAGTAINCSAVGLAYLIGA